MDGCARVSAVLGVDHQNGEDQEPHAHAEAEAVHGLVAHEHVAVDVGLDARDGGARAIFTEARNLESQRPTSVKAVFKKETFRESRSILLCVKWRGAQSTLTLFSC